MRSLSSGPTQEEHRDEVNASQVLKNDYESVSQSYWASVRGTTERRNWRNMMEALKTAEARMASRVFSVLRRLTGWMRTWGFLESVVSTETTFAVPMAAL